MKDSKKPKPENAPDKRGFRARISPRRQHHRRSVGDGAARLPRTRKRPAWPVPAWSPITLTINGKAQKLEVEPRETLLDTLRNKLDLTAAKRVCDRAPAGPAP